MFVGRKEELKKLDDMYHSDKFEFAVFYGRRRVGKTTLINEFGKDKKMIYFMAVESSAKENLNDFSKVIWEAIQPDVEMPAFESYEKLLNFVDSIAKERIVLVIDEFPYLAEYYQPISSMIQRHIDQNWKDSKLLFILCGSSMSFMEEQVLGYKSPLYGRRTAQFKVQSFTYFESALMLEHYNIEEKALLYGVMGGIPEYLSRINLKCGVDENIIHLFFDRTGRMFEEPGNLLNQELRSLGVYNAVIQGIAAGCSRLNEIATRAGVDNSTCANQITTLVKLGLVKKEIPITENENSRKTIYRLEDSMFSFWYRFVMPNISSIEKGMGRQVYEKKVKPHLNDFMGMIFETICLQYMYQKDIFQEAPFFYGNMGRWWGNNSKEKRQEKIDLLAFDEQSILLGECKWKNQELGNNVVENLIRKGDLFYQPNKWFYFFSKSGFSKQVQEKAIENKQIQLIGFAQMNEC